MLHLLVGHHKTIMVWVYVVFGLASMFLDGLESNIVLTDLTDVKGNDAIKEIRIMYTNNQSMPPAELVRGQPMFAEVEFVPNYIPSNTNFLTITTMIPANIRASRLGGPYVIGWNQEKLTSLACPLCTNREQSFTMPVTLFLDQDDWCAQGPVPTGWKIEAIGQSQYSHSDTTLAMVIDEKAQISIINRNDSRQCQGVNETIDYNGDMINTQSMAPN